MPNCAFEADRPPHARARRISSCPRHHPHRRPYEVTSYRHRGPRSSCRARRSAARGAAGQPDRGGVQDPHRDLFHRNIAQAFDSIPESKFGYKPTPAQLTFGFIAQHVASDSYVFCSNFGAMKPTIDAKDTSTPDSVKATWPKADLVSKLKASFAFCDQAIEQVTDATLPDAISFNYGGTERKSTRVNMVLLHALDLADHYSQIANYMRLNGMLPAVSAAEAGARRKLVSDSVEVNATCAHQSDCFCKL